MKNVILLVYHGMGHFNACFKIAKILKTQHHVVFAGVDFFKDYVEMQGFMYYPLKTVPFGMGFENWVNEQKKSRFGYFSSLKDRWTDALYKHRESELTRLLTDVPPDYILIDSYQSTDFIVLHSYLKSHGVKVGFIQTMMPTTVIRRNYPPINSLAFPNDKKEIKKAIRKFRYSRLKKRWEQQLLYLGMSDDKIITRRMRRNKLPSDLISSEATLRGVVFSGIHEFILAPEEFDFEQHDRTDFRHYAGFMPDLDRLDIADTKYFKIDSVILKKLGDTGGSLIYCSFGTVKTKDVMAVNALLQKLMETARDNNCIVIVSVNSMSNQEDLLNVPENVYFLKAAPQLEILKRADIFITHGGLNSIKESIYNGVPMLVYPLHSETDTMGNSTRVVHHQLGLRGDLLCDTEHDIGKKIEELLVNDAYKKNIQALHAIDEAYADRFMELFTQLNLEV